MGMQTITSTVVSGSVALSGGAIGISVSGAGVGVENRIGARVLSYITGGRSQGKTILADSVSLKASDVSTISTTA